MLSTKIAEATLERLDFVNDELEQKFEAQNAAHVQLVETGAKFESAVTAAGGTLDDGVGEAILGLAFAFGKSYSELDDEQKAAITDAFSKVFKGADEATDTAGQELFDATLEYYTTTVALNTYVNDNTSEPEEPVEPGDQLRATRPGSGDRRGHFGQKH